MNSLRASSEPLDHLFEVVLLNLGTTGQFNLLRKPLKLGEPKISSVAG